MDYVASPPDFPFNNSNNNDDLVVVGIGASAGGVQALKQFFENVKPGEGLAYAVVLHLSPDYDSKLAEVIQTVTQLQVMQVTERVRIKSDHVYVVPPNQHLLMADGHLSVSPNITTEDRRAPVDIFFRKLAETHGQRAICVVLSGTGANGSMGLKRIKEMGGAALVQNPREAEFNEMPRNSIATELVDEILNVADIPGRIVAYKNKLGKINIPIDADKRAEDQQQALRDVFTQLKIRTGHDFSNYKRPTLLRRIERRINVRGMGDINSYATLLQENAGETTALLKDLLISVTNFFRDQKAFEVVGTQILPALIKKKTADGQLRIWVAGCATGEEAYSLAMLCAEQTMSVIGAPKIQIFATDIDEGALAQAREGLYTINDAADVSPERLHRFFNKEGDEYRIKREIREMILFANHNFIKDPPFSHLDIVSCRNVLIYLNNTAQERVMATFHFALNPGGFLFLGSSESADSANELYSTFNRENHIFQKRSVSVRRPYPVPESVPNLQFEQTKKNILLTQPIRPDRLTFGDLHQRLLEEYAPPSLIVNEEYDIVHLTEHVGKYLQMAGGEPSQNLLKLIQPELRLDLRSALYQAVQKQVAIETHALKITLAERPELIKLHIRPVFHSGDTVTGFILVLFERLADDHESEVIIASDEPVSRQLEQELIWLKGQLRVSNEQHEFNAEELKASNEELQAMNEELRSAAEELETSKEELQSINEELRTVNQELKVKVEETTLASNNLHNLINSVDIGTIFLDRSLRVAFFTPAARALFNLIPSDYGRPLSDITGHLKYDRLQDDVELVLEKLHAVDREVMTSEGQSFLMRVLPYRTAEDMINGVVITFVNISGLKKAEDALRKSEERVRLLIESAKDYAIFTIDHERNINSWNTGAEAMMGYSEYEILGQKGDVLFVPEDREKGDPELEVRKAETHGVAENERWHLRKDGSRFYGSGTVRPLYDNDKLVGFVKIMRDLTEDKKAEDLLRESEERLRITLESVEMGVWDWDVTSGKVKWNKQHFVMLGIEPPDHDISVPFFIRHVHKEDRETLNEQLESTVENGSVFQSEFRIVRADNKSIRWMNGYGRVVSYDSQGKATRIVGVMYDITTRKKLEQQKEEFIAIASHELRTPVTSIKAYSDLILERLEKSNEGETIQLMQKLARQVSRFTKLIADLLDTTKIVEGKLSLHFEEFDLRELIVDNVELIQRVSPKHQITVKDGNIPTVVGDKQRIEQVIVNMISNAVKYSPDGGEVTVETAATADGIRVSVTDSGIGMAPEVQARVFERFFRADTTRGGYSGMGLGLYISAGIIERHGGTIGLTSKPGEGSTFYFTLPLAR